MSRNLIKYTVGLPVLLFGTIMIILFNLVFTITAIIGYIIGLKNWQENMWPFDLKELWAKVNE